MIKNTSESLMQPPGNTVAPAHYLLTATVRMPELMRLHCHLVTAVPDEVRYTVREMMNMATEEMCARELLLPVEETVLVSEAGDEIEKHACLLGDPVPGKYHGGNLQRRAFPAREQPDQPVRPDVVGAQDIRQKAEPHTADHEFAREPDAVDNDPAGDFYLAIPRLAAE